jgi:N-acetylglucosaminyl-diphospho-decaprenol L-rhamnosyltransferase
MILCSIVSHNQNHLVNRVLEDFQVLHFDADLRIIITQNTLQVSTELILPQGLMGGDTSVKVIQNQRELGFGANHNQAYHQAFNLFPETQSGFFCVLNPDLRFDSDCFSALADVLNSQNNLGIVGPNVLSDSGMAEDFARYDPSIRRLLRKFFIGDKGIYRGTRDTIYHPDWIAGMFMLFSWDSFASMRGFDEKFFLYYEDADICKRARAMGYRPSVVPWARVTHQAQRESHRSLRRAALHFKSMVRYLWKHR